MSKTTRSMPCASLMMRRGFRKSGGMGAVEVALAREVGRSGTRQLWVTSGGCRGRCRFLLLDPEGVVQNCTSALQEARLASPYPKCGAQHPAPMVTRLEPAYPRPPARIATAAQGIVFPAALIVQIAPAQRDARPGGSGPRHAQGQRPLSRSVSDRATGAAVPRRPSSRSGDKAAAHPPAPPACQL
jgi:hypothetical protein